MIPDVRVVAIFQALEGIGGGVRGCVLGFSLFGVGFENDRERDFASAERQSEDANGAESGHEASIARCVPPIWYDWVWLR